ncbi:MAG: FliM/FliN family flagellar motor switch protein [Massilia sp.]
MNAPLKTSERTGQVQAIELDDMAHEPASEGSRLIADLNPLHQVKTSLQVSVGNLSMSIGELMALKEQQVLRLGQKIDDAVELLIEGKPVARGQLVAVDGYFAVRITELPVALQI